MTGKATQPEASFAANGIVGTPNCLEELEGVATSFSSTHHSHLQSDLYKKRQAPSQSWYVNPMTNAQLEAEAWRPSYKECRESSVENDYACGLQYDNLDSEWEAGEDSALGLSSPEQSRSANNSPTD